MTRLLLQGKTRIACSRSLVVIGGCLELKAYIAGKFSDALRSS